MNKKMTGGLLRLIASLLVAAAVLACPPSTTPPPTTSDPPVADDDVITAAFLRSVTDYERACAFGADAYAVEVAFFDGPFADFSGGDDRLLALVADADVFVDGDNFAACANGIAAGDCDDRAAVLRACGRLLVGNVDDGGACSASEECKSGRCNRDGGSTDCGVCDDLDDECAYDFFCGDGAFCTDDGRCRRPGDPCERASDCAGEVCADGACVPLPVLGEACGAFGCAGEDVVCADAVCVANVEFGAACAPGVAICDRANCVDGVCTPLGAGDACISDSKGDPPACGPGLVCESDGGDGEVCVVVKGGVDPEPKPEEPVTVVEVGEDCGDSVVCTGGGVRTYCAVETGTCTLRPRAGEDCGEVVDGNVGFCAADSVCDLDGVCFHGGDLGDACEDGDVGEAAVCAEPLQCSRAGICFDRDVVIDCR